MQKAAQKPDVSHGEPSPPGNTQKPDVPLDEGGYAHGSMSGVSSPVKTKAPEMSGLIPLKDGSKDQSSTISIWWRYMDWTDA